MCTLRTITLRHSHVARTLELLDNEACSSKRTHVHIEAYTFAVEALSDIIFGGDA